MIKGSVLVFILLLLQVTFSQCNSSDRTETESYGSEYPMDEATGLAIDNCMELMGSNPDMAHHTLDSLRQAKLISPERCDYYHAMILLVGENNEDSALIICDRLLDKGDYHGDIYLEEEICELASNITSGLCRHVETLKYANRGIALCHGNKQMSSDEAAFLTRVGKVEQLLGRTEQAKETYAKAYSLLQANQTFGGLISLISLMKKQANLAFDAKDYDQAIQTSQDVIALARRFDRDPSFVEERPETMRESCPATHDFADFYECQMYGNVAHAYCLKVI